MTNHETSGNTALKSKQPTNRNRLHVMNSKWITTREAADIMGITRHAVAELCRRGKIKCRKPGRDWQVWRDDAEAYDKPASGRPPGGDYSGQR